MGQNRLQVYLSENNPVYSKHLIVTNIDLFVKDSIYLFWLE